jgi:two-component system, NtrC family, response regulator GlrR
MMCPQIIIFDETDGQPVGSQLKAFLQREKSYQVKLVGGAGDDPGEMGKLLPRLLMPVFPPIKERAEKLLAGLGVIMSQVPLLPVVSPEALSAGFCDRLMATHDFLVTPIKEAELRLRVQRLTSHLQPEMTRKELIESCELEQLIGEDMEFVALKRKISIAAKFESTVLLTGETGTGKEKCARALHYLSARDGKPFLPVNCGAIPVDLFESELFGHEKGAFTSACVAHRGLIAEADGGTLFLDEIESLNLTSQVKLLRFLQDRTYYPIGSAKERQANVRIIAATNVDLHSSIRERTFREDLFYRLAVINLVIPPLRQRKSDIPLLAAHFWKMYGKKAGQPASDLSPEVVEALSQYSWPGNVRELENIIQQLTMLTESQTIRPEDLPVPVRTAAKPADHSFAQRKASAIEEFERSYITEVLRAHQGNVTRAALQAKMERRAFGRLIKKYQIAKR